MKSNETKMPRTVPAGMHVYDVRMVCDHVEQRLMRPATAGVAPGTELKSDRMPCAACRAEVR